MCPACDGRAVSLPVLRRAVAPHYVRELWLAACAASAGVGTCPMCGRRMAEVAAPAGTPRLDVCRLCQLVWFDPGEAAACPPPPPPAPPVLPREAREALAMLKVELAAREEGAGEDGPAEWWKVIPAVAGLPVEYEAASRTRRPLAT